MSKTQWIAENLKPGEIYAGIILGQNGENDYHLVVLPGRDNKRMNWSTAMKAAKADGGDLPTRRELRVLWANVKHLFQDAWYWSNEQNAGYADGAWIQDFTDGYQLSFHKSNEYRARAVRRILIIQ
jgi:hypothetical protein